ncbi:MAG: NFACT family protein [Desulfobacterales bacterium]|nr:NFACT family protein [Desulfobacterales bacterium]
MEERLRSRQAKLLDESREFDRAQIQQRMGEILVAHQAEVSRGATQVTLPDPAQGAGATLVVPLDPSVSPSANAERLFKAARRGRRGATRVTTPSCRDRGRTGAGAGLERSGGRPCRRDGSAPAGTASRCHASWARATGPP